MTFEIVTAVEKNVRARYASPNRTTPTADVADTDSRVVPNPFAPTTPTKRQLVFVTQAGVRVVIPDVEATTRRLAKIFG